MQFKAIHPDSAQSVHVEAEDAVSARAIAATEFGEALGRTADAVHDQVFVSW
ncbi:Uncharacterised protein [Mycobacteroides abscessus subsp. bolletii]|uniref:Uncharacterized protein n=1 Tax=Mycobacteroides abscessus subsp. bolletii TaxID=319705 RepID=A0A9Q7SA79_9MYCO|nr:hypothetical protein [Mycobacteroides abscessus]SHT90310.1 Uncharacterised protein [Mycobacteroides abscessus subsp. bolletii]SHU02966.1 Uncharacterised protein [Mycobacteroides abscessus subsp. bolletii]SHW81962.1 Uncharacterised protein [Mycobacteroides abscessus subsp. bolletii]SIC63900.1 Uncharacterised protein [Mycobacteroides abscessus subsp. abscessus]SKL85155.1 Uncharacterised protein [Mycobacteroides abscessus subsp. bolletii]